MTPRDFINQIFLAEYAQIVPQHAYISFALIGIGTEFLGACLDSSPFSQTGLSRSRVRNAIQTLFPNKYHSFTDELTNDLRNGFAHQFRPGRKLEVSQRSEGREKRWQHLGRTSDGRLCLFIEEFYDDFAHACRVVITKIDVGDLCESKLRADYLRV
jgi:hypothetical protein